MTFQRTRVAEEFESLIKSLPDKESMIDEDVSTIISVNIIPQIQDIIVSAATRLAGECEKCEKRCEHFCKDVPNATGKIYSFLIVSGILDLVKSECDPMEILKNLFEIKMKGFRGPDEGLH